MYIHLLEDAEFFSSKKSFPQNVRQPFEMTKGKQRGKIAVIARDRNVIAVIGKTQST